ncbi:carboxylesterase family protein [Actinomadura nitritigenes]|uniref:carboxylesterase family protein n=1 Tax=Actinomadura nitritigenes TaxID=134602 RepID=UPI003D8AD287
MRENIAAFGGDPDRVTLFGQSAGATIVGGVLTSPEAGPPVGGRYAGAIVKSASGLGAFTPEQAARVTRAAARAPGVEPHAGAFAAVPVGRLVEVTGELPGIDPRIETHTDPLIGLSPLSIRSTGNRPRPSPRAPERTSTCWRAPTPRRATSTRSLREPVHLHGGGCGRHRPALAPAAGPGSSRPTAGLGRMPPPGSCAPPSWATPCSAPEPGDRSTRTCGATYRYSFAWRSNALSGELGAAHAVELPFLFDATGDPGWDRYDTERRTTMRIDDEWTIVDDPHGEELRARR